MKLNSGASQQEVVLGDATVMGIGALGLIYVRGR